MPRLLRPFLLLAAGGSLSGCILDRLWETHRQFYAKDPQVIIENAPDGSVRFRFLQPTLLESDIDWLIGQPPTRRVSREGVRFADYILVQEDHDKAAPSAIRGRVHYVPVGEQYRLAKIELPRVVSLLVTPEMISAAIETLRYPAPELLQRRLRVDLKSFHDLKLPSRREIEAAIGSPNEADETTATYRFRLQPPAKQPAPAETQPIEITLRYAPSGRLRQAEGQYLRYRVRVDLEKEEAILNVR